MAASEPQTPPLDIHQTYRAGDIISFPTGKRTFLSPLPLPTYTAPLDFKHVIGELNDTYLDIGGGLPTAFSWQATLGGPFMLFLIMALIFPLFSAALTSGEGYPFTNEFMAFFEVGFEQGSWGGALILALALLIACHHHFKARSALPTRFNRQRREVYYVPEVGKAPIVVPWESVAAWVTQAQGVTQYGVQRQYGLGIGFYDPATRQPHHLEMPMPGLPLALGLWEAIRGYMEHEVNSLQEIQDPHGLQRPGDPPHEGVHTFHNARDRLHRRYRDGEIGLLRVTMWYLWHVIVLWTIPHHVTEWEIRALQRAGRKALPEAMQTWSQPLPESEWARPSEELKRLSAEVDTRYRGRPPGEITEIFAEVYQKERLTA